MQGFQWWSDSHGKSDTTLPEENTCIIKLHHDGNFKFHIYKPWTFRVNAVKSPVCTIKQYILNYWLCIIYGLFAWHSISFIFQMWIVSIWLKSDLYLRYHIEDLITLHYWSCSTLYELCLCIYILRHDFNQSDSVL